MDDATVNSYKRNRQLIEIRANALLFIGLHHLKEHDYKKAIRFLKYAQESNPNFKTLTAYRIADAYLKLGTYRQAIRTINKERKTGGNNAMLADSYLGDVYRDLNQTHKAIKHYSAAIEAYPYAYNAYTELGKIYFNLDKFDSALDVFTKAIAKFPESASFYYFRARCYQQSSLEKQAVADYRRCISLSRKDPNYYTMASYDGLGGILYGSKKYEKALLLYNKAIKVKPDLGYSYINRALTHHNLRMWDEALADYKSYISLSKETEDNRITEARNEIRKINRLINRRQQK